ncbi:MAG: hypothetical protein ACLQDL_16585 [Spirochaetia bacterium]
MKSFPAFGILFGSRGTLSKLRTLLEENSGLPGPRANLELAHSFAAAVGRMHLEEWQWEFLLQTAATSPTKAPVNTPGEYVPLCAVLALGVLYGTGLPRPRRRAALSAIRTAASDPRWRLREAAAMALQLIGEQDLEALKSIVTDWLPGASALEMRAIAAGLAHPPILSDEDFAGFCMETARTILNAISRTDARDRKQESFKILRQGMGYALSVFVSKRPGEGFTLMRKSAAVRDADISWIIRENLKKKRLTDRFAQDVQQVALILEEANAGRESILPA